MGPNLTTNIWEWMAPAAGRVRDIFKTHDPDRFKTVPRELAMGKKASRDFTGYWQRHQVK